MNANGAGDVRQRGLEDKHLLASNFIVPGCIGDCDQRRDSVTDEQIWHSSSLTRILPGGTIH